MQKSENVSTSATNPQDSTVTTNDSSLLGVNNVSMATVAVTDTPGEFGREWEERNEKQHDNGPRKPRKLVFFADGKSFQENLEQSHSSSHGLAGTFTVGLPRYWICEAKIDRTPVEHKTLKTRMFPLLEKRVCMLGPASTGCTWYRRTSTILQRPSSLLGQIRMQRRGTRRFITSTVLVLNITNFYQTSGV